MHIKKDVEKQADSLVLPAEIKASSKTAVARTTVGNILFSPSNQAINLTRKHTTKLV